MKKEISEKIEVKDTFFSYDRQIICGKDINSGDKKARAERRWPMQEEVGRVLRVMRKAAVG